MLVKVLTDNNGKAGCPMNYVYLKKAGHFITVFTTVLSLSVHADSPVGTPTPPPLGDAGAIYPVQDFSLSTGAVPLTPALGSVKFYESLEGDGNAYLEFEPSNNIPARSNNGVTGEYTNYHIDSPIGCASGISDALPLGLTTANQFNVLTRAMAPVVPFVEENLCTMSPGARDSRSIGTYCACVSGKSNPKLLTDKPSLLYSKNFPREASRSICEDVVSTGLVSKFTGAVEKYAHSSVVSELLKAAGKDGAVCNAENMNDRFKKMAFDQSEKGLRECSSQSLSYLIHQVESSAAKCKDDTSVFLSSCSIPESVIENLGSADLTQREAKLESLLTRTKALKGPEVNTPEGILAFLSANPDQKTERDNLRREYEQYIAGSTLEGSFSSMVKGRVDASLLSTFATTDLSRITQDPDKKKKAILGILKYINDMKKGDPERTALGGYPSIAGLPTFAQVMSGTELKDGQVELLLNHYQGKTSNRCAETTQDFLSSCKMLTPGSLFDISAAEGLASQHPDLVDEGIISNHLDVDNWLDIINGTQFKDRTRASQMQSLMCAVHYNNGGLKTDDASAFEKNSIHESVHAQGWLRGRYRDPNFRNNALLGADHQRVLSDFNNCSPFSASGVGSESRQLYDEYRPLPYDLDEANAMNNLDQSSNRSVFLESGGNADETRAAISQIETSGFNLGSSGGAVNRFDGPSGSTSGGLADITERTRREFSNSSPRAVSSEASEFYNSMDSRRLSEMTSSFVSQYSTASEDSTSRLPSSINSGNAQEELIEARSALGANDELLSQLADLEKRNRELNDRLKAMNIKEIQDEDGNTVSVTDAFNKTNDRIAEQRAKAMEERKKIEQREQAAQAVIDQNRSGNGFDATSPRTSSTNTLGDGGTTTQRNSGGSSTSSSSISTTSGSSSGISNFGSNSSGSNDGGTIGYGPSQYSGIVLTADALTIAKPSLDLGGRSLEDSSELIREAISAVKSALQTRNTSLPAYTIDGKAITEYIVQEKDGKNVIVYLDGDKVKVQEIDLSLESTQVVVEVEEEVEVVVEPTPARAPAFESSGRKNIDITGEGFDNRLNEILENAQ